MFALRASRPTDGPQVVEIWRAAVDATHDFLSAEHRAELDEEVQAFLPYAALWLAVDEADRALGFMGLSGSNIDSLFIDPARRGQGIGRALIAHAASLHPVLSTDVNAQNLQAVGFYARLGFVAIGRSPTDDRGRPYPLLHLRRGDS